MIKLYDARCFDVFFFSCLWNVFSKIDKTIRQQYVTTIQLLFMQLLLSNSYPNIRIFYDLCAQTVFHRMENGRNKILYMDEHYAIFYCGKSIRESRCLFGAHTTPYLDCHSLAQWIPIISMKEINAVWSSFTLQMRALETAYVLLVKWWWQKEWKKKRKKKSCSYIYVRSTVWGYNMRILRRAVYTIYTYIYT